MAAEVGQALNDVGFRIAANASAYWAGESMGRVDYDKAAPKPDTTVRPRRRLRPTPRIWPDGAGSRRVESPEWYLLAGSEPDSPR